MSAAAERAERIALAILSGDVPVAEAIDSLRLANRERAVEFAVDAVRRFRSGEPVAAVPVSAPWARF